MSLPAEVAVTDAILRRADATPNLIDDLVEAGIPRFSTVGLPPVRTGLVPIVPDLAVAEEAATAGYDSLGLVAAASEAFSERHLDGSVDELMHRVRRVLLDGPLEVRYRAYVETITHCPYEGEQDADWVAHLAETLIEWGADEVVLVESLGKATPFEIERVLFEVQESVPSERLGTKLSDAYGMAIANAMSVLDAGVASFESTAGGIDGFCATEDLVHLLDGLEVSSGIDPIEVARTMVRFCERHGFDYKSRAGIALLDAGDGK